MESPAPNHKSKSAAIGTPNVIAGRQEGRWVCLPNETPDTAISITTQNLLAQCYFDSSMRDEKPWLQHADGTKLYDHTPVNCRSWPDRRARLYKSLINQAADVICLQEVEFKIFDTELLPTFKAAGYEGTLQTSALRSNKQLTANATFHNARKLDLVHVEHRSRALHTCFRPSKFSKNVSMSELMVANVHLQGDPARGDMRVGQIKSTLKEFRKRKSDLKQSEPMIDVGSTICGDFNEDITQHGKLKAFLKKEGKYLRDAYGETWPDPTYVIPRMPLCRIDFFVLDPEEIQTHFVVQYLSDPRERADVFKSHIPNDVFASDHLPLSVCFEVKPQDARRVRSNDKLHQIIADSVEEASADIWERIPIKAETKTEYLSIEKDEKALPKVKGKPNEEHMRARKLVAQRRKELLETLSEDERLYIKLYKSALKRESSHSNKKVTQSK